MILNQTNLPNNTNWIISVLKKESRDYPQDESTEAFKELKERGYNEVEWKSGPNACPKCTELNGKKWTIDEFLSGLSHNAPVFEKSHVGDKTCYVIVRGPDLEEISVGPWPFA